MWTENRRWRESFSNHGGRFRPSSLVAIFQSRCTSPSPAVRSKILMMNPDELSSARAQASRARGELVVGRGGSKVAAERPFSRIYCPYVFSSSSSSSSFSLSLFLSLFCYPSGCRCCCCWCCPSGSRVSLLSEERSTDARGSGAPVSSRVNSVALQRSLATRFAHRHAGYFPGTSAIFHDFREGMILLAPVQTYVLEAEVSRIYKRNV